MGGDAASLQALFNLARPRGNYITRPGVPRHDLGGPCCCRPDGRWVQSRWKTSVPLILPPPGPVATHLTAMVVGLTKRPDQIASMLQSDVQFLDVWNPTRRPRTPPAIS
jgi:hypothetical protein